MNPAPIKAPIDFELFDKIDLRVATIIKVEEMPDSDSLVRIEADFGDHRRWIVVGMKQEREDVAEILGLQALFVVNLKPRRIRGSLSEAMLVDAGYADGLTPVLMQPEAPIPNGTRAG